MPSDRSGRQQLDAAQDGSTKRMKAALEDGANVDEHPRLPHAPIVAATIVSRADMVSFLLEQGADPDRPVTKEVEVPCVIGATTPGERALHIAARSGNVEIVRLLLKRSRADPNATDNDGYTPLLATCASPYVSVEVVPLLLEAGADPALADEKGFIPLHTVATKGLMDLVDILHSTRSNTLNRRAAKRRSLWRAVEATRAWCLSCCRWRRCSRPPWPSPRLR